MSATVHPNYRPRLHTFTLVTAAATLFLIFAGGMVTSTGSGLSVPDWPLSYGMVMPPMIGGIFYEHGHRMVATAVGFLTLVQCVWLSRVETRSWLRKLGYFSLFLVIFQGVLGGMTVLLKLPPAVSVFHACVAQSFLCVAILITCATSHTWLQGQRRIEGAENRAQGLASLLVAACFVQLILGAVMRHWGAGLAVANFPLLQGGPWPPINFYTGVHLAHRYWAFAVATLVVLNALRLLRNPEMVARAWSPAFGSLLIVVLQLTLGALTVLTVKSPVITSLHVMTGAALLGTSFYLAVLTYRTGPVSEPSLLATSVA